MRVVTRSELQDMSDDQRWALIPGNLKRVKPPPELKTCKPDWIGGLYCNQAFPHWTAQDGTMDIAIGDADVFSGMLRYRDQVHMTWRGYACQLYDGEFKMCPAGGAANPEITGTCNGVAFKFAGTRLEYGVWPGFLLLYE